MKKVAVINFSGNVGKSSIAHYLLAPRMDCEVLSVESINDVSGQRKSKTILRGKEIHLLREYLLMSPALVVDVGASNVEDFVQTISEYDDAIDDFEYFVVPTVPTIKQQEDTVATIDQLVTIQGVPGNKILLVFNHFDKKAGPVEEQYRLVFSSLSQSALCHINVEAVVPKHGFFEAFRQEERSLDEVLSDETDYRELICSTDDKKLQVEYVRKLGMKSLAMGINKELDHVYAAIIHG